MVAQGVKSRHYYSVVTTLGILMKWELERIILGNGGVI
jgi:hypothetical protein